ncbi:unnamed protein product [Anisakis simplex]|uniref:Cerebellar degeneration-related protein 2-like n=1 Tax=Anisakis simplex TaxID=6269 RepID=A0A0M3JXW0_ANISI|nr:unnamed protein product [Anisakis simplex]
MSSATELDQRDHIEESLSRMENLNELDELVDDRIGDDSSSKELGECICDGFYCHTYEKRTQRSIECVPHDRKSDEDEN